MKFSSGGIKTLRNVNDPSKNAELLIRGGFIDQLSAGVYTYLPLGRRVLDKIIGIIKEEMNAVGGVEILMPALHPAENWKKTGRWEAMDDLYRFTSFYSKLELALGATHEEVITPLAKKLVYSYKDLPLNLYQVQTKFRDEKRAKSGLLRNREFPMKDLYSFDATQEGLDKYYEEVKKSYVKIYDRMGIGEETYVTFASGGTFSKYSHEFQTACEAGEDIIYLCEKCKVAINKEIIKEQNVCPECKGKDLKEIKAIEVGNIFKLGTKYSDIFDLKYLDKDGTEKPVLMGCYGIGPSRVMGTIVEKMNDERGIVWPEAVAPFTVHLIDLDDKKPEALEVYKKLTDLGVEVLWDDRDESAGVKLSDADLIGCPYRVLISARTEKEGKLEVKKRTESEAKLMNFAELEKILKK